MAGAVKPKLRVSHPDFASLLWDPQDADHYSSVSKTLVRWRCPVDEEHDWVASPKIVVTGAGCNVCSGSRFQLGKSDLWTTYPEVAKNLVDPQVGYEVTAHSSRLVLWRCGNDSRHEAWSAAVLHKVLACGSASNGCGVCRGKKVQRGVNDLWTTYPQVAKHLVDPRVGYGVTAGSGKEVWWRCEKDSRHNVWSAPVSAKTVAYRSGSNGCGVCSGRKVQLGVNDLWTTHPQVAKQLVDSQVGYEVTARKSRQKVLWRCTKDSRHDDWSAPVASVVMAVENGNTGCGVCYGRRAQRGVNDLWTTYPLIAEQLVNSELGYKLTAGSNKVVEWRCVKDSRHRNWSTSPNARVRPYKDKEEVLVAGEPLGCPVCSGHALQVGVNDLWTVNPGLAAELVDPQDGYKVVVTSNVRLWWKCVAGLGHPDWPTYLANRSKWGNGCPVCSGTKVLAGYNDIGTLNPRLAEELVDKSLAGELMPRSERVVWWQCRKVKEHRWETMVSNRTIGRGCPDCAKSGFKVNRKGWLYVLVSEDVRGCSAGEEFVQFGISGSLKSRLESHRAYGFRDAPVLLLEGRGRVVWDVERLLKDFLVGAGCVSLLREGVVFGRSGGSDETYRVGQTVGGKGDVGVEDGVLSVGRIVGLLDEYNGRLPLRDRLVSTDVLTVLPGSRVYRQQAKDMDEKKTMGEKKTTEKKMLEDGEGELL